MNLFKNIYSGKKVLITGNTGFKGSWLALWLLKMNARVTGYSVNIPTEPSHFKLLNADYETIFGDILDNDNLYQTIYRVKPDIIFHLAAQSLVRKSYREPFLTYSTNVIGTLNLLEAARRSGSIKALINVTTDKVYKNHSSNNGYNEENALGGHDIYSSSKACSEILTESYQKSFFDDSTMLLASARAGNVIGGGDWSEDRLLPDIARAVSSGKVVIIRYPDAIRPWQHVLEPLSGYLLLGQKLLDGKREFIGAWNFGPEKEDCISVDSILKKVKEQWNELYWKKAEQVQPYEAETLILDSGKAKQYLGWSAVRNVDAAISKTVEWYINHVEKKIITEDDLNSYLTDAERQGKAWCQ